MFGECLKVKAWQLRLKPCRKDRTKQFLSENIVAIGYPGIGDLSGKTAGQIKELLNKAWQDNSKISIGLGARTVIGFAVDIRPQDFVVAPDGNVVHIGVITSDYFYDAANESEEEYPYPHQRRVRWLEKNLPRHHLPPELQSKLRNFATLADISDFKHELIGLVGCADEAEFYQKINQPQLSLLRADNGNNTPPGVIKGPLEPAGATFDDLVKLAKKVLEEDLKSDDPERRFKAAVEVLRLSKLSAQADGQAGQG